MGFVDAVKSGFKNYVTFTGRAARSEYWFFVLAEFLALSVGAIIDSFLSGGPGLFYGIVALGFFLPALAVSFRRIHDTDRSAWWLLISIVPLIGLILIFWFATRGTVGSNKFGSDPLGGSAEEVFS